jgi:anti-anti-sigma regulatory factor
MFERVLAVTVTWNNKGGIGEIHLVGAVNIACAAELKEALMDSLSAGQQVCIFVDQITELDVCILQLLLSASRVWRQVGLDFRMTGPWSPGVSQSISEAGFPPLDVSATPSNSPVPVVSLEDGRRGEV